MAQPVECPPDTRFAKQLREFAVPAARVRKGGPGTSVAINANVAKDSPLTVFGRTPAGD